MHYPAASGECITRGAQLTLRLYVSVSEQAMGRIGSGRSISLITFGFSVYKFFQIDRNLSAEPQRLVGPRGFAIAMIALGIVSLLFATYQHLRGMKELRATLR